MPPLLVQLDRRRSMRPTGPRSAWRWLPRTACWLVVLAALGWAGYGAATANEIVYHNDYKLLQGPSEVTEFFAYVDSNIALRFDPTVILVDSVEDARRVQTLARQMKERGRELSWLDSTLSLADLVPTNVAERAERIAKLRELVSDRLLSRAAEDIEAYGTAKTMVAATPWQLGEVPASLRDRLQTLDGTQVVVLLWCTERIESDATAVVWGEQLAALEQRLAAEGVDHTMSTEILLPAWIYRLIRSDSPRVLLLASLVVVAIVALFFRRLGRTLLVCMALGGGMLGFVGLIYASGIELNMFNLIILPCVIGIGIDDVVHIYHRHLQGRAGSIGGVLHSTGVAVLVTSVTTGIGFGSSLIAHHLGLRSLGTLALVGIGFMFVTATVVLPSLLVLVSKPCPQRQELTAKRPGEAFGHGRWWGSVRR